MQTHLSPVRRTRRRVGWADRENEVAHQLMARTGTEPACILVSTSSSALRHVPRLLMPSYTVFFLWKQSRVRLSCLWLSAPTCLEDNCSFCSLSRFVPIFLIPIFTGDYGRLIESGVIVRHWREFDSPQIGCLIRSVT